MGKTVSSASCRDASARGQLPADAFSLYAQDSTAGGGRKYLNRDERKRVLGACAMLDTRPALFILVLAWTGARVSEILALTPRAIQVERSLISIVTLKRRRWSVREVPIPPELMRSLAREFSLLAATRSAILQRPAVANAPFDGMASCQARHGGCQRVGTRGLSTRDAPRIRCRDRPGRRSNHAPAEMDGACAAEHHGNLLDGIRT